MTIRCLLCGLSFSQEQGRSACDACTFSRACRKVCCPNCGYPSEVDVESPVEAPRTLGDLPAGGEAVVTGLATGISAESLLALTSLDLLPGARVRMVRRFPALVARVGHRSVTLDRGLARHVLV